MNRILDSLEYRSDDQEKLATFLSWKAKGKASNCDEHHFLRWSQRKSRYKHGIGFGCSNTKIGLVKWISPLVNDVTSHSIMSNGEGRHAKSMGYLNIIVWWKNTACDEDVICRALDLKPQSTKKAQTLSRLRWLWRVGSQVDSLDAAVNGILAFEIFPCLHCSSALGFVDYSFIITESCEEAAKNRALWYTVMCCEDRIKLDIWP